MRKLPISAIVASHNEGPLLEDCLKSIRFCDEIVLVNMESSDATENIGRELADKIVHEQRVELVEHLFPKHIPALKNDWVMLIDPDERIDPALVDDIVAFFHSLPQDCGRINVPILYYYKKKPLRGTVWGGVNKSGRLLIKRSACHITGNVHTAITLRENFITYRISRKGNNVDHHFWVQSYAQMLEKHRRYSAKEGKSRYEKGDRFTYYKLISGSLGAFKDSFIVSRGYLDGVLGFFLSCFYAWYIWASWLSLKKYQKEIKNGFAV
jgi:glycosyltransferase involved in cell wall biosynthesis